MLDLYDYLNQNYKKKTKSKKKNRNYNRVNISVFPDFPPLLKKLLEK